MAAEKILKIWENLDDKSLSRSVSWIKYYWILKFINLRKLGGKIKKKLFPSLFGYYSENNKILEFEKKDINDRVQKILKILKLDDKIECKILSKRTILIKKIYT